MSRCRTFHEPRFEYVGSGDTNIIWCDNDSWPTLFVSGAIPVTIDHKVAVEIIEYWRKLRRTVRGLA